MRKQEFKSTNYSEYKFCFFNSEDKIVKEKVIKAKWFIDADYYAELFWMKSNFAYYKSFSNVTNTDYE